MSLFIFAVLLFAFLLVTIYVESNSERWRRDARTRSRGIFEAYVGMSAGEWQVIKAREGYNVKDLSDAVNGELHLINVMTSCETDAVFDNLECDVCHEHLGYYPKFKKDFIAMPYTKFLEGGARPLCDEHYHLRAPDGLEKVW